MSWSNTVHFTCRPVKLPLSRTLSTQAGAAMAERRGKLLEIYAPRFGKLEKNSKPYEELARSGRVWEDYFEPWNSEKLGYVSLQRAHDSLLKEIDEFKDYMNVSVSHLAKVLVAEYAHQSVALEGNRLRLGDSLIITDILGDKLFGNINMASAPVQDLLSMPLPKLNFFKYDTEEVMELTNHIIASYWIAETAASRPGSAGLNEDEIRHLSALTNRGTASEAIYTKGWGRRISLGDYRVTPISVSSNPTRIFPYPAEVPELMKRFLQWRDRVHQEKQLHPLILACQATLYFLAVHPFPDGNERVGRMFMHDYMVRQGYLPVVMQNLKRQDYLRMINDAEDGKPEEFVLRVLMNQLEELQTLRFRGNST